MSRVVHKYMPEEMPEEERLATFAARHETLERLTCILREQRQAETLNNILLTGGRGAGKTTLVLMLAHRIESDDELRRAWLPVRFPEELPAVTSLRDLMASTLSALAERREPEAGDWLQKAEAELDEAQSLEIAVTGLRQIVRRRQRRLVLFVENLDAFFARALNEQEEAHLRRLLMTEPFFMIVGTAVRLFPEIADYSRPFFNFFQELRLDRLNDEQVEELLLRRADYHHHDLLRRNLGASRPSIRAISRLTGGNPRLVVMLYEVLQERRIGPVVGLLRELIDELTPLLKDVVESLPAQQGKVLDALMRRGGTGSPHELVEPTRLSLNIVTTQLTRLRDAHLVEVYGGGKGRKAVYVVPDQLFCTWYQLRYLRPNRRRIEMIVEFLRIFFTEEERYSRLQESKLYVEETGLGAAVDAEYLAASPTGTAIEQVWRAQLMRGRARLRMGDLAGSLADLKSATDCADINDRLRALFVGFAAEDWLASLDITEAEPVRALAARATQSINDPMLRREAILAALHQLAGHNRRDAWLALWETFEAAGTGDAELFDLLRPAYQALKSGDRDALGALPVDQRELIRAALERFDQR